MTSRLTSEKCMPSWPIEMPSETETVPNCERVAAAGVHALLRGLGQAAQAQVAGGDLVPRARDADLGLVPVRVAHADGAQHSATRHGLEAVGDRA